MNNKELIDYIEAEITKAEAMSETHPLPVEYLKGRSRTELCLAMATSCLNAVVDGYIHNQSDENILIRIIGGMVLTMNEYDKQNRPN